MRTTIFGAAIAFISLAPQHQAPSTPSTPSTLPAWPGLWGPARTGSTEGPKSPSAFKELWRKPSAGGYSEVVSVGDRAYTLELKDGVDDAVAFDAQSGREVWRARIAETYRGHDGSHDGPIGTPAIDAESGLSNTAPMPVGNARVLMQTWQGSFVVEATEGAPPRRAWNNAALTALPVPAVAVDG
jgi:hypothetical protein